MIKLLAIGIAGGIGSVARYLCQRWIGQLYPHPFPLGTFLVNMAGCFLIGLFFGLAEKNNWLGSTLSLMLLTGFCGGFTTFSAFAAENLILLRDGRMTYFLLYIALSVLLGIFAVWAGLKTISNF